MKHSLLILLGFTPLFLTAQNRFTLGLVAGMGQNKPCTTCNIAFTEARSVGVDFGYKLVSGFYVSLRNEYQARIHHSNPEAVPFIETRKMDFLNIQTGLQWQSDLWYAGAGLQVANMLKYSREYVVVGGFCGVGSFIPPPGYVFEKRSDASPYYSTHNYSGAGFYFRAGFTPRLTAKTRALIEANYSRDYSGEFGNYPTNVFLAGMRLGLQTRI